MKPLQLSVFGLIWLTWIAIDPAFGQQNPFVNLKADSVVLYEFEMEGSIDSFTKRARLNDARVNELSTRLGKKKSYGAAPSICFNPHLGIAYYRGGETIAVIEVCFLCNRLRSSLPIVVHDNFFKPDHDRSGMSKSFRKFLSSLIAPHGFRHQIVPGDEPWD